MIRPAVRKDRVGFTLIEMLVVIAIIAVLAGLILAGVMVAFARMRDNQNAQEINQMVNALANFKSKFGFYPPSKLRLYATSQQYVSDGSPLALASLTVLTAMWPRIGTGPGGNGWTQAIDWTGGNVANFTAANAPPIDLDGDQCLVFFLGGIPAPQGAIGVVGFSASPTNPALLPGVASIVGGLVPDRLPTFFTFPTNRLVLMQAANGSPFFSFADIYATVQNVGGFQSIPVVNNKRLGQPFAYFATYKQPNKYNPYLNLGQPYGAPNVSDCDFIGAMPYYAPKLNGITQFQNSSSYQIISAGVDQIFGSTTPTPTPTLPTGYTAGAVIYSSSGGGAAFNLQANNNPVTAPFGAGDDRTNFCPNILSAGGTQ